jgi:Circadian oscillating protein COP23
MKFDRANQFLMLALATVTMVGSMAMQVPSSQALTVATSFVCDSFEGKPATVAKTKHGTVPIVIWHSEGFSESGFTPQVRCKQVSARFQTLYRTGQLKYITAGTLNNLPVICATKKLNHPCSKQNLLYTLKPDADPQLVIKKLMMVRNRATSRGIEESATTPANAITNSIEVDWLEEEE